MDDIIRTTTVFENPLSYQNDKRRYGGVRASPQPDKKSFNLDNRGQLTSNEYMVYLGYLGDKTLAGKIPLGSFHRVNPTREDYSSLLHLIEVNEVDF